MARRLTRKQQQFVEEYVETGIGVKAALKAYDTDYNGARSIASQNLSKVTIKEAIDKALAARNLGPDRWAGVLDSAMDAESELVIGSGQTIKRPDHSVRPKAVDLAAKLSDAYPHHNEGREHLHRHLHLEIKEPAEVIRFKILHGRAPTERELRELMPASSTVDDS
jgi:hypothetical protein